MQTEHSSAFLKESKLKCIWASSSLIFIQLYRKPIFYGTFFCGTNRRLLVSNFRQVELAIKMKMVKKMNFKPAGCSLLVTAPINNADTTEALLTFNQFNGFLLIKGMEKLETKPECLFEPDLGVKSRAKRDWRS